MPSGKLAGISVKPFPRQSTMLLLQVQAEGQEMELALQDGGSECGPVGQEHSGQSRQGQELPGPLCPFTTSQHYLKSYLKYFRQLTSPLRWETQLPLAKYLAKRSDSDLDLLLDCLTCSVIPSASSFRERVAHRVNPA